MKLQKRLVCFAGFFLMDTAAEGSKRFLWVVAQLSWGVLSRLLLPGHPERNIPDPGWLGLQCLLWNVLFLPWMGLIHMTWPLAQPFCPPGRTPSQAHWCPRVPDRAAALGHFWNILPQTTEAEGQCTDVSQSFPRKSSQKPWDWINQQTMAPTIFGGSHSNLLALGRWSCTSAMLWQLEEFDAVLTQHVSQKLSLWGNLCVFWACLAGKEVKLRNYCLVFWFVFPFFVSRKRKYIFHSFLNERESFWEREWHWTLRFPPWISVKG